jgi:nitrite reductase/ring-hydroxylating ferredoxin subunit
MTDDEHWRSVGSVAEIQEGTRLVKEVNGRSICIFKLDGEFHACLNECPHVGGPVGEGAVTEVSCENASMYPHSDPGDKLITCPWHGWPFSLADGQNSYTEDYRIPVFDVKVENNEIYIK